MKEQWRKEMQQKLSDYRQSAPLLSWDEIEGKVIPPPRSAGGSAVMVWKWAVAAVVLLFFGTSVMLMLREGTSTDTGKGMPTALQTQPAGTLIPANSSPAPKNREIKMKEAASKLAARGNTMTQNVQVETVESTPSVPSDVSSENSNERKNKQRQEDENRRKEGHAVCSYPIIKRHSQADRSLAAKVYMSGMAAGSDNSNLQYPTLAKADIYGAASEAEMRSGTGELIQSQPSKYETRVRHRQPIRFGASVRYNLNRRWSVEGGLAYSKHVSEITKTAGQHVSETHQTLHYLGIPVNVNYRLWSNKHFNVYASAGGAIEKMINGKAKTRNTLDEKETNEIDEKVEIKRPQLSLTAGLGAEYKLDKLFSVYVEPGISRYIDNGSDVETIYKEKPTNFNLNIGLRFNFK